VQTPPRIRQGQIYWLSDCPPLDGDDIKTRPVVVVDDARSLEDGEVIVIVLGATSRGGGGGILLPHSGSQENCLTGLDRPTWVIPHWILLVERTALTNLAGHISGRTLRSVLEAYEAEDAKRRQQ
jgi:hypothetical protein